MIKTIRGRVIFAFIAVFTIVFVLYGYTVFSASYRLVYRELQKSSEDNLRYVQGNINRLLDQFVNLSNDIYYNRNISKVLVRDYDNDPNANLDKDLRNAIGDIDSYEGSGVVAQYATCLIIHGNNGKTIRYGNDADFFTVDQIRGMDIFEEYSAKHNANILCSIDSPSERTFSKKFIQIIRAAISLDSYKRVGWQYMGISTDLIADTIEDYNFDPTSVLFVYDRNHKVIYSNQDLIRTENAEELLSKNYQNGEVVSYDGSRWMMVSNTSIYSGLTIMQLIDYRAFRSEISLFLKSMIGVFVMAVFLALILTSILTNWLTKPIQRSIKALGRISGGDFSVDRALESDDEVGRMGRAINSLAINIDALMKQAREEESQKKQLEYKLLQNQINPHFVYNVLNSIKVMAQLQGAENISRLVDNFGGLLKEVSKGVNDKVPMEEEFELADQYIYIMNLRKKGLIHTSYYIEEGCENCAVLKFLLQPLVENAIVHGFEGKLGVKELQIEARKREGHLEVSIRDNGNGMTEEEIRKLLTKGNPEDRRSKYNSIGINNIQERIHLLYGEEYGVSYESVKSEFTKATVKLPLEFITE